VAHGNTLSIAASLVFVIESMLFREHALMQNAGNQNACRLAPKEAWTLFLFILNRITWRIEGLRTARCLGSYGELLYVRLVATKYHEV
jgi:hypothetical protein